MFTLYMNLLSGRTCNMSCIKSDAQHEIHSFLFIAGQGNHNQKVHLSSLIECDRSLDFRSLTNYRGSPVKQRQQLPKKKPAEECQEKGHAIMLQDPNAGEEMANKVHKHSEQTKSNILDQSFITMHEREKKDVNAKFAALVS